MKNLKLWNSIIIAGLVLTACGDSNTTPKVYEYKVSLKNLTYAQPLSPMVVSYHDRGENLFTLGESVTVAFEKLAEGGSNTALLEALKNKRTVNASEGGNGVIVPSKTDSIIIFSRESSPCISVASMLVNTNDAVTGINCIDVSKLEKGEKIVKVVPAYDAGTEANSETNLTIPGPVAGGEGFNALRDDKGFIYVHANVVTKDEGLMTSVLTQAHKWDNPTAMITVERVE